MSKSNKTHKPPVVRKSSRSFLPQNLKARRRLVIIGALFLVGLLFLSFGFVGGTLLEDHNDFCASCHTVPESTYFNRSVAAIADKNKKITDLATMHFHQASNQNQDFQCISCHRGDSSLGDRIQTLLLGAKDTVIYVAGKADPTIEKPTIAYSVLVNAACIRCHETTLLTVNGISTHFHNFLPQTAELLAQGKKFIGGSFSEDGFRTINTSLTCTSCHLAHKTVDTSNPNLKLLDVPTAQQACDICHSAAKG